VPAALSFLTSLSWLLVADEPSIGRSYWLLSVPRTAAGTLGPIATPPLHQRYSEE
jgi:hypothetical protein